MERNEEYWDKYIDSIAGILDGIQLNKVTILTGKNGSGKSMIRKLLNGYLNRRQNPDGTGRRNYIAATSMDDRAGVDPSRMMVFGRDCEWLPTGENTLGNVDNVLKAKDLYMVLDEIELGMGEELQAGLAEHINSKLDESMKNGLGLLVITHSRTIVRHLKHDIFINIEGMTEEEWLNREIVPELPEDFKKRSNELYCAFQKRLK